MKIQTQNHKSLTGTDKYNPGVPNFQEFGLPGDRSVSVLQYDAARKSDKAVPGWRQTTQKLTGCRHRKCRTGDEEN